MRVFNYSCQGESHKADDKVCQDASRAEVLAEKGLTICVISDGHGGEQYFRSQVGSKAIVDIAFEKVKDFIDGMTEIGLLKEAPFTKIGITAEKKGLDGSLKEVDTRFMQLFRAIKAEWMIRIFDDAQKNPLNEWELVHVKEAYLEQFREKRSLEKIYGATLMAYVQTPDFWFAFHIGDGKMIMFNKVGRVSEPVLWDKDCFLNKTTSICQEDATDRFRYTFQGDGEFPLAMFLGSDGIDDTFTDGEPLHDFYRGLLQELSMRGDSCVEEYLKKSLPELSARGSRDDMTVAYCYDETSLKAAVVNITREQVESLEKEFKDTYIDSNTLKAKVQEIEDKNKDIIQEVEESFAIIAELDNSISRLTQELDDLERNKQLMVDEMEMKIQEIRNEYRDKLAEFDEDIQDKGTALTEANNKKAKFNTPENKAKKKIHIDYMYAKSDISKTDNTLDSLVTRINKLQEFLGEEITPATKLLETLFPKEEDEPMKEVEVSENHGGDADVEKEDSASCDDLEEATTEKETEVTTSEHDNAAEQICIPDEQSENKDESITSEAEAPCNQESSKEDIGDGIAEGNVIETSENAEPDGDASGNN